MMDASLAHTLVVGLDVKLHPVLGTDGNYIHRSVTRRLVPYVGSA